MKTKGWIQIIIKDDKKLQKLKKKLLGFFFFGWYWCLTSGLCVCQAGALQLEPFFQPSLKSFLNLKI
jgi:hypothetical protein